MSDLWPIKPLGELCTLVNKFIQFDGEIPYYSTGGLNHDGSELVVDRMVTLNNKPSRAGRTPRLGDVGFAKMKHTVKVLLITEELSKCVFSTGFSFLKCGPEILSKYLYYFLQSDDFHKQKNLLTGDGIMASIKDKHTLSISIPVAPLEDQQRIVDTLDKALEEIKNIQYNSKLRLNSANFLFKSKLSHAFRNMNVESDERKMEDVTLLITDGKHGNCEDQEDSGFYFLSAKDVNDGRLHYENARQITKPCFEETHRRTNLEPGDILLTNAGTIGRTAIAPNDEKTYKTTFQKSVAVIKPIREIIDSEYCIYHLRADLDKLVNVSAGAAQKNLLLRDIRSHKIKCPTLDQQRKISASFKSFENKSQSLENHYHLILEKMLEFRQSLFQEAFSGKLTGGISS